MSSANHRMQGFAESLRYRGRYIAERSAMLFLAGGSLLLVTATLLAIEAVTGLSTQGLLTGVTGFTGIILTYIGLLALEPWFANRAPRLARMGCLLVLLPTIVIVVLLVWGIAHHLPIGTVPSPIGLAPMDLIFMLTFLLFSFGVGLFGLVSLLANFPSWLVGPLLLALAATWIGLLVLSSVFGSKLPTVIDFITFAMMAGISLSIGYFLREYEMPGGYPEVASDLKG